MFELLRLFSFELILRQLYFSLYFLSFRTEHHCHVFPVHKNYICLLNNRSKRPPFSQIKPTFSTKLATVLDINSPLDIVKQDSI